VVLSLPVFLYIYISHILKYLPDFFQPLYGDEAVWGQEPVMLLTPWVTMYRPEWRDLGSCVTAGTLALLYKCASKIYWRSFYRNVIVTLQHLKNLLCFEFCNDGISFPVQNLRFHPFDTPRSFQSSSFAASWSYEPFLPVEQPTCCQIYGLGNDSRMFHAVLTVVCWVVVGMRCKQVCLPLCTRPWPV
jgi:hypothetical protein